MRPAVVGCLTNGSIHRRKVVGRRGGGHGSGVRGEQHSAFSAFFHVTAIFAGRYISVRVGHSEHGIC